MSTAKHHFSGSGAGTGTGRAPAEKSNFAQTCNRLSLFLKQKGNLRDLNFGISANFDATERPETSPAISPSGATTVDLLSNMEKPDQTTAQTEKSLNILPQHAKLEDSTNELASYSKSIAATRSKPTQMTIFYGGQVLVFDDIPADKATDLMLVARNGPSNSKIENQVESASTSKSPVDVPIHGELHTKGSDLPIARRASLHKFLAKRKDRAAVRDPYQVDNRSPVAASSRNEHNFDLNMQNPNRN